MAKFKHFFPRQVVEAGGNRWDWALLPLVFATLVLLGYGASQMARPYQVGQALPVGYDVYNVPYSYRATYYDTPNAWYRYNNGYIYQVDPATQLVTAIVASLLT